LLDSFLLKNVIFVPAEFRDNKACFDSVEKMLEKYGEKAVGIKVYFDTTVSDIQDIQPLCQVVEYAKKKDLRIMVHSSNSPVPMGELLEALRAGDILTHAYHGGINNASEDNFECLKLAKEKGVVVDAGFAGNVHTDFGVFENALKNGCSPDTISTDITRFSAYKRGGKYGMTMCMSIARKLGMNEEEIFRSVTSTPAKVLGMHNEWGYLKVGRYADISVFDYFGDEFSLTDNSGNTVKDENSYNCVLCICNGEVVYRK
jgi:dihydroorotase